MSYDTKKITIQLSIDIPLDGSAVQFSQSQAGSCQPVAEQATFSPTYANLIYYPTPYQPHPVTTAGSGSTGTITAGGRAGMVNGVYPGIVVGHCFQGTPTANPPASAASDSPDTTTGEWHIAQVGGAECYSTYPGKEQTLRLWYYRTDTSSELLYRADVTFYGLCESSDSAPAVSGATGARAISRPAAPIYLPTSMSLSVNGFSTHLANFNSTCTLQLVRPNEHSCEVVWRNSPTSAADPQIELLGNSQDRSARLVFQHNATTVEYTKKPGDWDPMGRVDFSDVTCRAVPPGASVPALVQVSPG